MANQFFTVFLITILVTRIFLFFKPKSAPTIKGFRIHHWMYGVAIIVFAFLVHSFILYAVGLGLFVDELTYILMGGKSHEDNYSKISLLGTGAFIVIVFFLRYYLILCIK